MKRRTLIPNDTSSSSQNNNNSGCTDLDGQIVEGETEEIVRDGDSHEVDNSTIVEKLVDTTVTDGGGKWKE